MALTLSREARWLAGILVVGCVALWLTAVPEVFTVDECNYLASVRALREGSLFVPGTADLTPSPELAGFDPTATSRAFTAPIAPSVPPLYAPFALPLSYLGWRALVLLNVLSFGLVAALVFALVRRVAEGAHAPWVAVALFALGGFSIDYAQGMWPQMLSVALCTTAVWLVCRERETRYRWLLAGGLCAGLAAGVRYQNVVFAAGLGLAVLLVGPRRMARGASFAAGVAVPLAISAAINGVRLGTFNPVTKGPGYARVGGAGLSLGERIGEAMTMLWVRVVDYSAHPPFRGAHAQATLPKDPDTGVFFVIGALKKSLLQSAPWIAIALVALVLVWRWRPADERRRVARQLSIPVVVVVALFAVVGLERNDGWSFNQRYLLELVPQFAVLVALEVDRWRRIDASALVIGGGVGLALAAVPILGTAPEHWFRQHALMKVPLVLAVLLVAAWAAAARKESFAPLRVGLLAAALGWALVVHVGDDVMATRGRRDFNGFQRRAVAAHLPREPGAIVAVVGQKEALCPLHLDYDLVMVDPGQDGGRALPRLVGELLGEGRRVFVVGGVPEPILGLLFPRWRPRVLAGRPIPFAEVQPREAAPAPP